MPDDPHSLQLATERTLMKLTGASRSQIRSAALGTPLRAFITNFQNRNGGDNTRVQLPPPPKIESIEQAFEPKPFRIESGQNQPPASAPSTTATVLTWGVVDDGTGNISVEVLSLEGNISA